MVEDVIVIGGGPGGYCAALYCARSGFSVTLLEKLGPGGQMANTPFIENYPGFEEGVDGYELSEKMKDGAERFGVKSVMTEVKSVDFSGKIKKVITNKTEYEAKTVIIATGADPRKLGIPEEDSLVGKGLAYCATCDGMLFRGKDVMVIGGGNSAISESLYLSKMCNKVYMVHRRDELRGSAVYEKQLEATKNLEIVWNSAVSEIKTDDKVTGVILKNLVTGELRKIDCEGIFVAIGRVPDTEMYKDYLEMDKSGFLISDETTKTKIPGVFAVGDVRTKPLRQIVTALSDGATASKFVEDYLAEFE